MGSHGGFRALQESSTADEDEFELAPEYEQVGAKTLCGQFGAYKASATELFAVKLSA